MGCIYSIFWSEMYFINYFVHSDSWAIVKKKRKRHLFLILCLNVDKYTREAVTNIWRVRKRFVPTEHFYKNVLPFFRNKSICINFLFPWLKTNKRRSYTEKKIYPVKRRKVYWLICIWIMRNFYQKRNQPLYPSKNKIKMQQVCTIIQFLKDNQEK